MVLIFSSVILLNKIGSLQKRGLCYLYSNYESPYGALLAKTSKVTTKASRLKTFCVETYKSINSIKPSFINEIFTLRVTNRAFCSQYRLNFGIPKVSQVNFGNKSIKYSGNSKIWSSFPPHKKSCKNLKTFKRVTKKLG